MKRNGSYYVYHLKIDCQNIARKGRPLGNLTHKKSVLRQQMLQTFLKKTQDRKNWILTSSF